MEMVTNSKACNQTARYPVITFPQESALIFCLVPFLPVCRRGQQKGNYIQVFPEAVKVVFVRRETFPTEHQWTASIACVCVYCADLSLTGHVCLLKVLFHLLQAAEPVKLRWEQYPTNCVFQLPVYLF